jgi:hypothetical protein
MQRLFRYSFRSMIAVTLVAALFGSSLAGNALAAKGKKKTNDTPAANFIDKMIKSVTGLTDDQTKKLDALKEEYNPKLKEAYNKVDNTLTADQKTAGAAASKAAKADGKKGKEVTAAVEAAEKITDDQKKTIADGKAQAKSLSTELSQKVMDLLTDAQKAEVKPKKK